MFASPWRLMLEASFLAMILKALRVGSLVNSSWSLSPYNLTTSLISYWLKILCEILIMSHGDDAAVLDFLIDIVSLKFVQSSGVKALNTSSVILVKVSRNVLQLNNKLSNNTKCLWDNSLLSILKRIIQKLRNLRWILLCCLTGMSWIIVSERSLKNR